MASHENVDVMALTSGVVAAAIATYFAGGYYGIGNLIFSFAIILTIVAYVANRSRDIFKVLAFAASLGVASLPAIGVAVEAWRQAEMGKNLILGYDDWVCKSNMTVYLHENPKFRVEAKEEENKISFDCLEGQPESNVKDRHLAIGWLVVFICVVVIDGIHQMLRHRQRKAVNTPA